MYLFCIFLLQYRGCSHEHDVIHWFWNVVSQLKEEEKALLMKFSTGSPCVPVGGFAALTVWTVLSSGLWNFQFTFLMREFSFFQGLSGPTKFTIMKIEGLNKVSVILHSILYSFVSPAPLTTDGLFVWCHQLILLVIFWQIPTASTCFNMLKLTSYSSEKHLKDKLLIAIRHGAEGFSFSWAIHPAWQISARGGFALVINW